MKFNFKKELRKTLFPKSEVNRKKPLFSTLGEKKARPLFASQELMSKQVKKVLSGTDQGIILQVRS